MHLSWNLTQVEFGEFYPRVAISVDDFYLWDSCHGAGAVHARCSNSLFALFIDLSVCFFFMGNLHRIVFSHSALGGMPI